MVVAGPVRSQAADDVAQVSARDAYRKGKRALAAKHYETASVAFDFAARHGVLGAQLELARMYSKGQGVARSDAKSFQFYQQIADKHADASPPHPAAGYAAEAFVALAESYRDGAIVLVDPISGMYLNGSVIDFVDDLIGASFQIQNPNATASCGCGTSFSL